MVDDEEKVGVEAVAINAFIPVCIQGATLSGTGEEDSGSPGGDETVQAEGVLLEFGRGEYSAIEADDGDLDCGA